MNVGQLDLRERIRRLTRDPSALRSFVAQLPINPSAARRFAIIPCAGASTRMGRIGHPKALHPINGVPSIVRLMDALAPHVDRFYLPINDRPGEETKFQDAFRAFGKQWDVGFVPVSRPLGDGDAVLRALRGIPAAFQGQIVLAWGDTTIVDPDIVTLSLRILDALDSDAPLVVPTAVEAEPYVALMRDDTGRICDVRYRRRGEFERDKEHDLSLFFFQRGPIQEALSGMAAEFFQAETGSYRSPRGELSFLDVFKHLYNRSIETVAPCIGAEGAVLSFNTPEEANEISHRIGA